MTNVRWKARMISPRAEFNGAPLLRTEYLLAGSPAEINRATLHFSALGIAAMTLDGIPVTDDLLAPGWSSYEWRLRYRSVDVTGLMRSRGVLGASLGNGWFRGRLTWTGQRGFYGDRLGLIAQMEVEYVDGRRQLIGTDANWLAGPSATTANDLYDGQTIDARERDESWTGLGAELEGWATVEELPFDARRLTPYLGPPVRRQQELSPQRIWTAPSGRTLIDFGQNLVGWTRLTVNGESGQRITVRHAEVLDDGELCLRPLRSARATDRFILSGAIDTFEPTMTLHGFRYAELEGWAGELPEDAIVAVVVHSDLRRIGHFNCSDPLVQRLHDNVVWALRGNFVDVPTDCPQRDERLGWTGDIAVFAPTAAFLYDVDGFLRDWLQDLASEQHHAGFVPYVVPDVLKYIRPTAVELENPNTTAIWGDAAVWVPWALYEAYGDARILHEQYDSMAGHLRRIEGLLSPSGLWDQGFQWGDWLDPSAPPEDPINARANAGVVATACAYRTATIVSEAARLTNNQSDADHFTALARRVRDAFNRHYVLDNGRLLSDVPTVYALAIVFDLLTEPARSSAGERLAALTRKDGYRIGTGFAGTPFVSDALTQTGHVDDAYGLLMQTSCPSWLYPVTMGATTIWERWDSMLPDGSINPGEMTSFNHYALGAVADWLHRVAGGLAPLEPGYARVLVAPRPGGNLVWAKTSLETRWGKVEVAWRLRESCLTLTVVLPDGVTGVLDLQGQPISEIGAGRTEVKVNLV